MGYNRIQKLLLSEYIELADKVLIESPFAETTRDGKGVREVALGITHSKLVIASDIFRKNGQFLYPKDVDPSIESLELISVYPLEYVTLSVFHRRRRKTLKARLIDGRAKYYELGGMERKNMFWALWCDHIRDLLARKSTSSSMSETSAASSSSTSTVYFIPSELELPEKKSSENDTICRIWAHYGGAGDGVKTWTKKHIYLGPAYEELENGSYAPIPIRYAGASLEDLRYEFGDYTKNGKLSKKLYSWPSNTNQHRARNVDVGGLCNVLYSRDENHDSAHDMFPSKVSKIYSGHTESEVAAGNTKDLASGDYFVGNRSSETPVVPTLTDGCLKKKSKMSNISRKLHSSPEIKKPCSQTKGQLIPKLSRFGFGIPENCRSGLYLGPIAQDEQQVVEAPSSPKIIDPYKLIESGVTIWESHACESKWSKRSEQRHRRRYGIATAAHFFHALGPWSVQPGERDSVQGLRSHSCVNIRRQPAEPELRLPVSRRQLAASVSTADLTAISHQGMANSTTRGRVILFWTPDYWYRPRAATTAYRELRRHLEHIRDYQTNKVRDGSKSRFFGRRRKHYHNIDSWHHCPHRKSSCLLHRIFSGNEHRCGKNRCDKDRNNSTTGHLRQLLKMDLRITIWDLDSTTIANQLTIIDRELFLRIPIQEVEIIVLQRSSRNAPNIGAWVAFGHRISCLMASEILAVKKLDVRARMVSRLINTANKCFVMGNFHSCRSIIAGLQSPAIYRLRETWSYLRTNHSIRYETMEKLGKMFKNPALPMYKKAWDKAECKPPSMPFVGDMLVRLLGLYDNRKKVCKEVKKQFSKDIVQDPNVPAPNGQVQGATCDRQSRDVDRRCLMHKKSLSQRIFSTFIRAKKESVVCEQTNPGRLSWSCREEKLARKASTIWRNRAISARKRREKEEAELMAMDPKKRKILEVENWLTMCQKYAQDYNLPRHSLAWEFLLKARYREDRENFYASLQLELPRT